MLGFSTFRVWSSNYPLSALAKKDSYWFEHVGVSTEISALAAKKGMDAITAKRLGWTRVDQDGPG